MATRAGNRASWGKASKGFAEALLDAGRSVSKKAAEMLLYGADEFLRNTDWEWPRGKDNGPYASGYRGGDDDHPWYSGNLHDSIATSISFGNKIYGMRFMPPAAREEQTYKGQTINGADLAHEAIARASHTFSKGVGGLVARLVIGVPYADLVNSSPEIGWEGSKKPNNHYDFISPLEEDFVNEVRSQLEELKNVQIRPPKTRSRR